MVVAEREKGHGRSIPASHDGQSQDVAIEPLCSVTVTHFDHNMPQLLDLHEVLL
jgi:hypothetical protein